MSSRFYRGITHLYTSSSSSTHLLQRKKPLAFYIYRDKNLSNRFLIKHTFNRNWSIEKISKKHIFQNLKKYRKNRKNAKNLHFPIFIAKQGNQTLVRFDLFCDFFDLKCDYTWYHFDSNKFRKINWFVFSNFEKKRVKSKRKW